MFNCRVLGCHRIWVKSFRSKSVPITAQPSEQIFCCIFNYWLVIYLQTEWHTFHQAQTPIVIWLNMLQKRACWFWSDIFHTPYYLLLFNAGLLSRLLSSVSTSEAGFLPSVYVNTGSVYMSFRSRGEWDWVVRADRRTSSSFPVLPPSTLLFVCLDF